MKLITLIKEISLIFKHKEPHGLIIIGIEKAGSTSLEKYIKSLGGNIIRKESHYNKTLAVLRIRLQFPGYQTILLLRDPVARVYSHYYYKRYLQKGDRKEIKTDLETALKQNLELLQGSNYPKWIKKWKSTKPIILHIEELQKIPGFPQENKSNKPDLNKYDKELIECGLMGIT